MKTPTKDLARWAGYLSRLSRRPRTMRVRPGPAKVNQDQECARRRRQIAREGGRTHYGAPIWEYDPLNPQVASK